MNKPIAALLAASFVFGSVFAFAGGASDQAREKQSITCPPEHSFAGTDNGIFACPSSGKEETILQKDEWRRKWTGIPKETWDKMTDEQKDKAFAAAKSGRAPGMTPKDRAQQKAMEQTAGDQKALKPYDCRDPDSPHSAVQFPIACVPPPKDSRALRDEAQRKSAGLPRERWDKMNGAEKAEAIEKAKAARPKDQPKPSLQQDAPPGNKN